MDQFYEYILYFEDDDALITKISIEILLYI